jgi:hypothetical protein
MLQFRILNVFYPLVKSKWKLIKNWDVEVFQKFQHNIVEFAENFKLANIKTQ